MNKAILQNAIFTAIKFRVSHELLKFIIIKYLITVKLTIKMKKNYKMFLSSARTIENYLETR